MQALAGVSLTCLAVATPFLAERENAAALSVAETESKAMPAEFLEADPASLQGRLALLETCIKTLTSLRFALLPEAEKMQILHSCQDLSDLNPGLAESGIVRAHLALKSGDAAGAALALLASQEAAPWDGWLAFQRVRVFLDLPAEIPGTPNTSLALQDDLMVLLAGTQHLEALAGAVIRRPAMREALFPALQELGPEATDRFLSAYYRVKDAR